MFFLFPFYLSICLTAVIKQSTLAFLGFLLRAGNQLFMFMLQTKSVLKYYWNYALDFTTGTSIHHVWIFYLSFCIYQGLPGQRGAPGTQGNPGADVSCKLLKKLCNHSTLLFVSRMIVNKPVVTLLFFINLSRDPLDWMELRARREQRWSFHHIFITFIVITCHQLLNKLYSQTSAFLKLKWKNFCNST